MNATVLDPATIVTTLLAQLPVGVVIADRDGGYELVNDVARVLFDSREHHTLDPIGWIVARSLLTGEIVREEEITFLDAHDEWRTLSVCATPLGDAGTITHALVTFVDITERNRARDWEPVVRALSRL